MTIKNSTKLAGAVLLYWLFILENMLLNHNFFDSNSFLSIESYKINTRKIRSWHIDYIQTFNVWNSLHQSAYVIINNDVSYFVWMSFNWILKLSFDRLGLIVITAFKALFKSLTPATAGSSDKAFEYKPLVSVVTNTLVVTKVTLLTLVKQDKLNWLQPAIYVMPLSEVANKPPL